LPIRWVLTGDPHGSRPANALCSPDQAHPAEEISSACMKRWSWEATFEEGRAQ